MTPAAAITLATILTCFSVLTLTRYSPDLVLMGGLSFLLLSGVIEPGQAFNGFSNPGVVTIAVLFVVVAGLKDTGSLTDLVPLLFGRPKGITASLIRLMPPVAAISAFMNNTPVVAVLIPMVNDWAKKLQIPVSKLMMPLSFAAIVGGTCSLIGTSTNLIVHGLILNHSELPEVGLFDIAWLGVPTAAAVVLTITFGQKWLLPNRNIQTYQFSQPREYVIEMQISEDSPLIGRSIEQAGLRNLPGSYLVEINRQGRAIAAVSPDEVLQSEDQLIFTGVVDSMLELRRIRGLVPATNQVFKLDSSLQERCLLEAVVSPSCPVVGKSIKEGGFRTHYNAAIIAVARNGERLKQKIGEIELLAGDTLLLETSPRFLNQYRNSSDFFLISKLDDSTPPQHEKRWIARVILGLMIAFIAFQVTTVLNAAILAAGAMLISRCTTGENARNSLDWRILITIGAAFALGEAMQSSGLAQLIGSGVGIFSAGHPLWALGIIFAVTALLTSMVSNNAAAVIMFPIALAASQQLEVSFMPFAMTLMMAASASFASPIGYQTNLMVAGPGGYHFADFLRAGIPLTIVVAVVTLVLAPMIWPF